MLRTRSLWGRRRRVFPRVAPRERNPDEHASQRLCRTFDPCHARLTAAYPRLPSPFAYKYCTLPARYSCRPPHPCAQSRRGHGIHRTNGARLSHFTLGHTISDDARSGRATNVPAALPSASTANTPTGPLSIPSFATSAQSVSRITRHPGIGSHAHQIHLARCEHPKSCAQALRS